MKIVTRQQWNDYWTAVDDASYDGPGCPIGAGPTEAAAIADLMDQLEERAREVTDALVEDSHDRRKGGHANADY